MQNLVKHTTDLLEQEANMYLAIADEILDSRKRILQIAESFKTKQPTKVELPTATQVEEEKKPSKPKKEKIEYISIAPHMDNFMRKYYKTQEEFTIETLIKRVVGLVPALADLPNKTVYKKVHNAMLNSLKKNHWDASKVSRNGVNHYIVTEDSTKH